MKKVCNLDDHDKEIIYHFRNSLRFNREQTWRKKAGHLLDVSMGAYNGGEVCNLLVFIEVARTTIRCKKHWLI